MNERDPVSITDSLDDVVQALRGGAGRREVGGVFGRWDEAVGPALAAHVRPVRLEHGALLVEVEDPAWATQVRLLADDLKRRLLDVAGVAVEQVDVRVRDPRRGAG
jgi:predicted nucleic acid-binding Zn ribbon protein